MKNMLRALSYFCLVMFTGHVVYLLAIHIDKIGTAIILGLIMLELLVFVYLSEQRISSQSEIIANLNRQISLYEKRDALKTQIANEKYKLFKNTENKIYEMLERRSQNLKTVDERKAYRKAIADMKYAKHEIFKDDEEFLNNIFEIANDKEVE